MTEMSLVMTTINHINKMAQEGSSSQGPTFVISRRGRSRFAKSSTQTKKVPMMTIIAVPTITEAPGKCLRVFHSSPEMNPAKAETAKAKMAALTTTMVVIGWKMKIILVNVVMIEMIEINPVASKTVTLPALTVESRDILPSIAPRRPSREEGVVRLEITEMVEWTEIIAPDRKIESAHRDKLEGLMYATDVVNLAISPISAANLTLVMR